MSAGPDDVGFDVGQGHHLDRSFTDAERRRIREEYGRVRTLFKTRPARFRRVQRWLNQARFGDTYDEYLARGVRYAVASGVLMMLVGAAIAAVSVVTGTFTGVESPVPLGGELRAVLTNRLLVAPVVAALVLGGGTAAAVLAAWYYYPSLLVGNRRRRIDFLLPHAIVYMYALSYGGMNLTEVIERLADADDAYGAVAEEFDTVRRDVELFGTDPYTALRNVRNLTPSDNLEQFLDDLVGVLESGGEPTGFFREQSAEYLRRAGDEQEDFLETLGILSEVFVVTFVAAPLFLVVILLVISVLGGRTLPMLYLLVYAVIPLGMALYVTLIATISSPYSYEVTDRESHAQAAERRTLATLAGRVDDEAALREYRGRRRRARWRSRLRNPLGAVRERPLYTLVVTVPLAVAAVAAAVATGVASPAALFERPVETTNWLVVLPVFVVAVPLSVFHEYRRGRADEVARRFPDVLNVLSSANNMGIPLTDAFDIVARWTGGHFADELRGVRNDIRWNADPAAALLAFADRMRVPQVARTLKLIAEGTRSTGDLSHVLSIAAEDTRNRYRMVRARSREMTAYVAVVVIGYLVYLLVVVMLDAYYLVPIERLVEEQAVGGPAGPGLPTSLSEIPVDTYRMVFYHSAIVQGVGSGILTGHLADGDLFSGLKYAIGLLGLAWIAFQFI